MAILITLIGGVVLLCDMRKLACRESLAVVCIVLLYSGFAVYHVGYVNSQSYAFGFGIPGADMLAHFEGAREIARGAAWGDLASLGARYDHIGISTICYFIYASFLSACIFGGPSFLGVEVNIYLIYLFQIFVSVDACLRLSWFFSRVISGSRVTGLFLMFALCVPFCTQACLLMRDVYYMWAMAAAFELVSRCGGEALRDWKLKNKLLLVTLVAVCVCLRFYSIVVLAPVLLYYGGKRKVAVAGMVAAVCVVAVGSGLLDLLRQHLGISWSFSGVSVSEVLNFSFFPSLISQTEHIVDAGRYFAGEIDVSGVNTPGVYYLMSIWNLLVLPLAAIGLFADGEAKNSEKMLWLLVFAIVIMIYSVSYSSIDTRHKLLLIPSLVFFAYHGFLQLRQIDIRAPFAYNLIIAGVVLGVYALLSI